MILKGASSHAFTTNTANMFLESFSVRLLCCAGTLGSFDLAGFWVVRQVLVCTAGEGRVTVLRCCLKRRSTGRLCVTSLRFLDCFAGHLRVLLITSWRSATPFLRVFFHILASVSPSSVGPCNSYDTYSTFQVFRHFL